MTETLHQARAETVLIPEDPRFWGPPEAPLDMPRQELERRSGRFEFAQLFRLFLPGQHI
ncbi:hypothetical protein OEZ60_15760 [Defluviimonas sp. WL0024]|uniref:Uncharacterized protein n=1 Tax=Albidovulum salinarum TaxID=2984153 RepID=A0ABT2X682_9RHOB|nr:hypothetical protein [Defluviimonas sp. WL0024]MCU9849456.1 hypothetical protein [Defluviimonas sp. WL0024]